MSKADEGRGNIILTPPVHPIYNKEPNLLTQKGDEDVSFLKTMRGREEKEERGGCLGDNIIDDVIIAPARLDGRNRDGGNETTD